MTVDKRSAYLLARYNITLAEYDEILDYQGGVCAVCLNPPKGDRVLHVDHDHRSGLVRGLLCWPCNGHVVARHRSGVLLRAAAEYLDNPPARVIVGDRTVPPRKPKKRKPKVATT